MAKSDMAMAFRHAPIRCQDWPLLILKVEHPEMGEILYLVDKCLPFGSSISCKIFQEISNGISHIVKYYNDGQDNLNYLDDYFFVALLKAWCDVQLNKFLEVCSMINFPVSLDKTFWGTTLLTFLGLLLDSERQIVCIPIDKVIKALELINHLLSKRNKKATVKQIQSLCGLLNFLCKCVILGRAFLTRLYALVSPKLKPHHHLYLNNEARIDLDIWRKFLNYPDIFCRPFMEFGAATADDICMYSDASGVIGFGALCDSSWLAGTWDQQFIKEQKPSIEFLELWALTAGVLSWIHRFKNRKIYLFCDNKTVRDAINRASSRCKNCMILIRLITLKSLLFNVRVYVKYVKSKDNILTDALSRGQMIRFRSHGQHMDENPTPILGDIWPLSKVWMAK